MSTTSSRGYIHLHNPVFSSNLLPQHISQFSVPCPAAYIKQATFRLLQSSEDATLIRDEGPVQVHASISHSYQTLLSSVCRHMLTSNSESAGKFRACWDHSLVWSLRESHTYSVLTFSGKKIGNHETMSLLFASMRSG